MNFTGKLWSKPSDGHTASALRSNHGGLRGTVSSAIECPNSTHGEAIHDTNSELYHLHGALAPYTMVNFITLVVYFVTLSGSHREYGGKICEGDLGTGRVGGRSSIVLS